MKIKLCALILSVIAIFAFCTACGSSDKAEGTWYSVEDATKYDFKDGTIWVSGLGVGEYKNKDDVVALSILDVMDETDLYVMEIEGVEVLADSKSDMGNIVFCRDKELAETLSKGSTLDEK